MSLIIPRKIKKGDTIAFISPSAGLAPFAMHRIDKAKAFLENEGYKVIMGKNALKNNGYVSATIEERVADLHEAFLDKEITCIICTIGGNHSNQLLKYIDWKIVKNNPKIFIGYSDISVLHYAINSMANLQTYYGPCVMTQFGENPRIFDYSWNSFKKILTEEEKLSKNYEVKASKFWTDDSSLDWFKKDDLKKPRETFPNTGHLWLQSGKASGLVVGGCIPSINHTLGTKYWIKPKGSIFFIDIPEGSSLSNGLSLEDLDSFLADLDNANVFKEIKGLVIGRPYHYSDQENKEMISIIKKYAENDYPILLNTNIGHADPIITLPYGSKVELDSDKNLFNIKT
jgi:muramoyltetrapeptide carboxypeptidase